MKKPITHKCLFIGRLNPPTTAKDVTGLLSEYGTVKYVTMSEDKCQEGYQYCFAEMSSEAEAQQCVDKLNNLEFKGQRLYIRY